MKLDEEVSSFHKLITSKTELFFTDKPSFQSGKNYFDENMWEFLRQLYPAGQSILDKYRDELSMQEQFELARTLQNIVEQEFSNLKKRLCAE